MSTISPAVSNTDYVTIVTGTVVVTMDTGVYLTSREVVYAGLGKQASPRVSNVIKGRVSRVYPAHFVRCV